MSNMPWQLLSIIIIAIVTLFLTVKFGIMLSGSYLLPTDKPCCIHGQEGDKPLKIAVLMYNIGNYDDIKVLFPWVPMNIDGYYYVLENDLNKPDRDFITSRGWVVVNTDAVSGTPYITSERLTSKHLKWNSSDAFKSYDFVVTHDASVRINYQGVECFINKHLGAATVLFKGWPYNIQQFPGPRVYQEINDMLHNRANYISMSRNNVIKWKEKLHRDIYYDDVPYFETNVFIFNPNCKMYKQFGRDTFEKCKKIQRDQFIVPFFLQKNKVPFVEIPQHIWKDEVHYKKIDHITRKKRN